MNPHKSSDVELSQAIESGKVIVFFDGICSLCNSAVDFIIRKDKSDLILFAPLQGHIAQVLQRVGVDPASMDSIVLYDGKQAYIKSRAILEICNILGGPWGWFYAFRHLPRFLTDGIYMLVSNNRYRVFGKNETCRLPTPQEQAKFLD